MRQLLRGIGLLLLGLALQTGLAASQDMVTADDTAKVLEIARGFGSAELETGSDGIAFLRGRMDGHSYRVFFLNCEGTSGCATLQFWTFLPAPIDPYLAVNDWNRTIRFGKAYVDVEGDVAIEMDVNLWGGVTPKNLDDTFDWWRSVLDRANQEFGPPGNTLPDTSSDEGKTL